MLGRLPREQAEGILYAYFSLGRLPPRRVRDVFEQFTARIKPPVNATRFYRPDPITFGTEVIGLKPNAKQRALGLQWYTDDQGAISASVLAHKRTEVTSCNSGGKTFWDALIGLWALEAGFRVLITASTLAQANAGVGAEIRRLLGMGPPGLGGKWSPVEMRGGYSELHELVTFSVSVGTKEEIAGSAAGRHYERMCLIIDEANSVSAKLIEQVDRICTNPHDIILATLNPTPPSNPMRAAAKVEDANGRKLWNSLTINGENHPNVVHNDPDIIPGAITREMIADQLAKAGGNRKHFFFAPPVLGEYADSSSDSLINEAWIDAAQARWRANNRPREYRGKALALDVAGTGGDASSMWGMEDWRVFRPMIPESFVRKPETMRDLPTLRPGATWMRGREVEDSVHMVKGALAVVGDVRAVAIDSTGLGSGPTSHLQSVQKTLPKYAKIVPDTFRVQKTEEHYPSINGYNFGAKPIEPAARKFKKFKDQLLWNLREGLRLDEFDLPPDDVLRSYGLPADVNIREEMMRAFFGVDATGHLIVVDKRDAETGGDPDMAKRAAQMPSASPNELHAIALAFWEFKKLPKGLKPITTGVELEQAGLEKAKKQARDAYKNRNRPKPGVLPWHRR